MIARSPTPERWAGIYLTIQTLAQFVLAAALAAWVISRSGANGGFVALAVLCVISAVASLALPNRFAPLVADSPSNLPNARGFVALAAPFLWMAFIVGVWVYAEPLSRQAGHAPTCRRRRGFRISRMPGARRCDSDAARGSPAMVPHAHVLCADQRRLPARVRLAAGRIAVPADVGSVRLPLAVLVAVHGADADRRRSDAACGSCLSAVRS